MRILINLIVAAFLLLSTANARVFNATEAITILPAAGTDIILNTDNASASLPMKLGAGKQVLSGLIDLTSEVTGVLPAVNGGNVVQTLTNTQIAVGDGSNLVSSSASLTFNSVTGIAELDNILRLKDDGQLQLFEPIVSGTNSVTHKTAAMAADYSLTLPIADGAAGQALTTNGLGVLSFTAVGGGGSSFDNVIGAGETHLTLASLEATGVAGDSAFLKTETVVAAVTFTKQFGLFGGGFGSQTTGNITYATGSNGSSIEDIRINGSIIINAGVKNIRITDCWLTLGNTITDNSGNTSNLILCQVEE